MTDWTRPKTGCDTGISMKRLGEILLDWGVLAVAELHTALEACRRSGGRLGTQLLRFGFVDERSLLDALSEQNGVPSVTSRVLGRAPIEIRGLLAPKVARRLQAVPFGKSATALRVAMTNPGDRAKIEEMIGGQIFLELNVRVQKDWTKDDKRLKELGYKPGG